MTTSCSSRTSHPVGLAFTAPFDVVFSEFDVAEPGLDTIKVYRRVDERDASVAELSLEQGDGLATSLLSGLEMPLARIVEDWRTACR